VISRRAERISVERPELCVLELATPAVAHGHSGRYRRTW
jgi:hypothetical protein